MPLRATFQRAPVATKPFHDLCRLVHEATPELRHRTDASNDRFVVGSARDLLTDQDPWSDAWFTPEMAVVVEPAGQPHPSRSIAPPRLHRQRIGAEPGQLHAGELIDARGAQVDLRPARPAHVEIRHVFDESCQIVEIVEDRQVESIGPLRIRVTLDRRAHATTITRWRTGQAPRRRSRMFRVVV